MRDRLVELLKNAHDEQKYLTSDKSIQAIADYLIANGVVMMPCKVGGKVYIISKNKVKECVVSYIGFSAVESCSSFNFVEYYADGTFYRTHSVGFDEIGKTVFLAREDAERALEGEKG